MLTLLTACGVWWMYVARRCELTYGHSQAPLADSLVGSRLGIHAALQRGLAAAEASVAGHRDLQVARADQQGAASAAASQARGGPEAPCAPELVAAIRRRRCRRTTRAHTLELERRLAADTVVLQQHGAVVVTARGRRVHVVHVGDGGVGLAAHEALALGRVAAIAARYTAQAPDAASAQGCIARRRRHHHLRRRRSAHACQADRTDSAHALSQGSSGTSRWAQADSTAARSLGRQANTAATRRLGRPALGA